MKNKYYYFDGTILNHYDETKTLHREGAPAIEFANGDRHWYLYGEFHREDGPAVEYTNGVKYWYLNGEFHREDGPAIEYSDGTKEWYLNGKYYTEERYNKLVPQKELDLDFYL